MFESTAELAEGVETDLGIIEAVSMTACLIGGAWVPFTRLVASKPAVPLAMELSPSQLEAVFAGAPAMRAQSDGNVAAMLRRGR